jgi:hypothetical protein
MNLIRRAVETLVEHFIASVGSVFAARIETVAALMHAQQQEELEERARQFEEEGKPQLATDLRSRASQLAAATPRASGGKVLQRLQSEHAQTEPPRIAQIPQEEDSLPVDEESAESTNPRATRRRSCRRPQND